MITVKFHPITIRVWDSKIRKENFKRHPIYGRFTHTWGCLMSNAC